MGMTGILVITGIPELCVLHVILVVRIWKKGPVLAGPEGVIDQRLFVFDDVPY